MRALQMLSNPEFLPILVGLAAMLGLCVGSFLTLITYRLPRDERIGATRSQCTNCTTVLRLPDLIPVLSWLAMRGKCRRCDHPIGARYPLTELASGVGAALLAWRFGFGWDTLALCGLWWCFVAIVVTDLEHYIILDEVQIALALFGVLHCWAIGHDWVHMGAGVLVGLAIGLGLKYGFLLLRHKDGLGMGDVKFLGVAGIWLADAANFVPFLFFSGVLGIASALVWRALGHGERFPFGPALALSLIVCVLFPHLANGFWQLYGLIEQ